MMQRRTVPTLANQATTPIEQVQQHQRTTVFSLILAPLFFLQTLLFHAKYLDFINSIENGLDFISAKIFKSLLGHSLYFTSHSNGCVLVTSTGGENNGIGNDCAVHLANKGYTVFCGVRQLHEISALRSRVDRTECQRLLVPVLLPDATNEELLDNLMQSILHHFESIETSNRFLIGIINTASERMPESVPLEDCRVADWNRIFSANLVGPFSVISKFLPLLRLSRGRIINVSSFTSQTSSPMNGLFACSKIALENATDTLRNEVYSFGISVSLIQPGALEETPITPTASPPHRDLYIPLTKTTRLIRSNIASTPREHTLIDALDHALFAKVPKTRYFCGWDVKATRWIRWTVSDRVLDYVFQGLVRQNQ